MTHEPFLADGEPSRDDVARITAVVGDYYDGYFSADPARIDRSLHPELVKRSIESDQVRTLTAEDMVQITDEGGGSDSGAQERWWKIESLDVRGDIASAVVISFPFVDYLHLGHIGGEWRIVNALWSDR